jgi:hypothetical protein|tara:strand:- start:357 stop:461 length:105 start_codon:yes stop_codon:yes gene_type:complete
MNWKTISVIAVLAIVFVGAIVWLTGNMVCTQPCI